MRDKRRRIEFLKRKQPNSQNAPPADCLSEAATEGGVILEGGSGETRDAGAEIKETDD